MFTLTFVNQKKKIKVFNVKIIFCYIDFLDLFKW